MSNLCSLLSERSADGVSPLKIYHIHLAAVRLVDAQGKKYFQWSNIWLASLWTQERSK